MQKRNFLLKDCIEAFLNCNRRYPALGFYRVSPDTFRGLEKKSGPSLLDEYGSNLASVLWLMRRNNGTVEGSEELTTQGFRELRDALKHLMPGITDVKSVPVGEYLSLQFKHSNIVPDQDQWLNAAQESDGTLRLLALLTAIYQLGKPPLLGIEEPETAVHPGVLPALAEILEEASLRQQVVITTHSPDLIDRFPHGVYPCGRVRGWGDESGRDFHDAGGSRQARALYYRRASQHGRPATRRSADMNPPEHCASGRRFWGQQSRPCLAKKNIVGAFHEVRHYSRKSKERQR